MTAVALRRLAACFVAPLDPPAVVEPAVVLVRGGARAAVLGAPRDAVPVAAALAGALLARDAAPAAMVMTWCASSDGAAVPGPTLVPLGDPAAPPPRPPAAPSTRPATRGAARVASRLASRGLAATARGRLAWLALDEHPVAAALAARRVAGALDLPVVLALTGSRVAALDALLADQDLVVLAVPEPEGALARLALAGLAESPTAVIACAPLPRGPQRLLALAGLSGRHAVPAPVLSALREPR
jgi:hypothetical protein